MGDSLSHLDDLLEVYAEFVHKFRHSPVLSKILGTKILYSSKL